MTSSKKMMRERLRMVAAGEVPPNCPADEPEFAAIRQGVNASMRAWFREHNRFLVVSDDEIRERLEWSLRAELGRLSGIAPGVVDIDVDIEIMRQDDGTVAYAFRYARVRN